MYVTLYGPPSSSAAVWLRLEYSIKLSLDCNADVVIVVRDFNDNQLISHCRKVKYIMKLNNLHQLINEAINFTEHSQSLIDLILTNNPSSKTYTEVGPALMDLTRFHCPTYGIIKCKKHTSSCYKRNIWLNEKGNYDDLKRDFQSVQLDTLIAENDVNQSVTNVTPTILQIALSSVPTKAITIRIKDYPCITNDIKCDIRKKNRYRTRAKHLKSILYWERFRHIRNECMSKIRIAQITYFEKLFEKLHDDSTSTKDWWNIAKQISNLKNKK